MPDSNHPTRPVDPSRRSHSTRQQQKQRYCQCTGARRQPSLRDGSRSAARRQFPSASIVFQGCFSTRTLEQGACCDSSQPTPRPVGLTRLLEKAWFNFKCTCPSLLRAASPHKGTRNPTARFTAALLRSIPCVFRLIVDEPSSAWTSPLAACAP